MNRSGLVCAKSPGKPPGSFGLPIALSPRAASSPMMIVSPVCPVAWSALQPWFTRLRNIIGATETREPSIAWGARSSPKLGSFQIAQKPTCGNGFVCPGGMYVPL